MADRGRDLKIGILTDVSKFDTEAPARDLDALGDAAAGAGTHLDDLSADARAAGDRVDTLGRDAAGADLGRLGADARAAGADVDALGADAATTATDLSRLGDSTHLDRLAGDVKAAGTDVTGLGTDAKGTAAKVDSAFDAIAKSAQSNLRDKVAASADDGAEQVGESAREMGDEIKGEALEGAASFDGSMTSVVDSVQSAAAMALSALGPLGVGIGVAAAAGLGVFRAQADKMKETVTDLVGTLMESGGQLNRAGVLAHLQTFATDGTLLKLRDQAERVKLPARDFMLAMAGDPGAMARTTDAITSRRAEIDATYRALGRNDAGLQSQSAYLRDLELDLGTNAEAYKLAAETIGTFDEATGGAAAAQLAMGESLASFTDPLGVYTDALGEKQAHEQRSAQATADATAKQSDSWEDYADDVAVSVDEYLDTLADQVEAQEDWQANMSRLAGRVSDDTLAELARMGPEGAPLVKKLTSASDRELGKLDDLFRRRSGEAVNASNTRIRDGAPGGAAAGKKLGASTGSGLAEGLADRADAAKRAGARTGAAGRSGMAAGAAGSRRVGQGAASELAAGLRNGEGSARSAGRHTGAQAGAGVADGIAGQGVWISQAAARAHARASRAFERPITVPMRLDTYAFDRQLNAARARAKYAAMDRNRP